MTWNKIIDFTMEYIIQYIPYAISAYYMISAFFNIIKGRNKKAVIDVCISLSVDLLWIIIRSIIQTLTANN